MNVDIVETEPKPFTVTVTPASIHEFLSEQCHMAALKEEEARLAYEKAKQYYADAIVGSEHLSKLLEHFTQAEKL
jgi:uncharacterized protein VirK/YbjX